MSDTTQPVTPRTLSGVLHAHTVFSDGTVEMAEWVSRARENGFDFIAVSDHAESFDSVKMKEYVRRCAELSDEGFLVIPGLEFSMFRGRVHILGYGVRERLPAANPASLVRLIREAGGVSVLAHPRPEASGLLMEARTLLDGIEIWNGRYDGLRAPNIDSIQLLRGLRRMRDNVHAFSGLDIHKPEQWGRLFLEVEAPRLDAPSILDGLRDGRFTVHGGNGFRIPADGRLSTFQEFGIAFKRALGRTNAA